MENAVTLLIVEDDEIDLMGIKRALKELRIKNPTIRAKDGVEALEILRGENGHEKLQKPYIILLDLNMPRMDGVQFLQAIRDDEALKKSVVFVLTTSDTDEDITSAYTHNVAGYIVKSDAKDSFREAMNMLDIYWTIVQLPEK
jgi:CheY-like chemotaxis protein